MVKIGKSMWCRFGAHDMCPGKCKCSCHDPQKLSGWS
jgi:hypothetical protein